MNSLAYIFSGLMFLIASAGAVDGTASPMWVAVLGFIGVILMFMGIKNQEED
tara:strand:- start:402 stop:557 length:156 start_codon:yes stop_codon:yes gene_type:complete